MRKNSSACYKSKSANMKLDVGCLNGEAVAQVSGEHAQWTRREGYEEYMGRTCRINLIRLYHAAAVMLLYVMESRISPIGSCTTFATIVVQRARR